jgi:HSP20 family protein
MVLKDFISRNLPAKRDKNESHLMARLQNEMNRIFDRFFDDFRLMPFSQNKFYSYPSVDVKETKKEVQVTAELPGLDVKDIDIHVNGNTLTLRGEKTEELKKESENYYHMERKYGSFHRNISLPSEVDSENVKANYRDGVLSINLVKKPEDQQKVKKIEIKTS